MKCPFFASRAVLAAVVFIFTAQPLYALSDAEKDQKRQELERYFSSALLKTAPESAKPAHQAFRFSASGATRYGYESNVDLDSAEDGDTFYEEKASVKAEYAPESFSWAVLGLESRYNYLGYFDRDDLNRQSAVVSPYFLWKFNESFQWQNSYLFRARLYDSLDDLDYLSHGLKSTLSHKIFPELTHRVSFAYESLDYSDRKLILSDGRFSAGLERDDDRHELSYEVRYRAGRFVVNAEGVWLWNESNDEYFDYNDYEDAGLNASVSYRATDRLILSGFGGWHFREYDSRAILPGLTEVQDDDWFYAGARVFYAVNTWSGIDITCTYYENDSNDPSHEYDSTIFSAGYHLYF